VGNSPSYNLLTACINAVPRRPTIVENSLHAMLTERVSLQRFNAFSWHRHKSDINALQLLKTYARHCCNC